MESYFKTAPEKLFSALPKCVELIEEDGRKIKLPKWRPVRLLAAPSPEETEE